MSEELKMCAVHKKPLPYHIYTIWLFTRSDLKTIVGPSTLFALVGLLSGPILTTNPSPLLFETAKRLPRALAWIWINLLPFNIDNQRQPNSIAEDLKNKAWRPLRSRRLSPEQATRLMLALYLLAFLSSLALGGVWQCIGLMALGYWYNDLHGGDRLYIRNFINACGYIVSPPAPCLLDQTALPLPSDLKHINEVQVINQDLPQPQDLREPKESQVYDNQELQSQDLSKPQGLADTQDLVEPQKDLLELPQFKDLPQPQGLADPQDLIQEPKESQVHDNQSKDLVETQDLPDK
ncbi:hypothetical protein GLAREA_08162 [Glarea lozoyensis ATCC 20868]|uniref:Uncharacterized protein n=1 Tax=Glarea lozoyensis (strain ATCC 20868 / MF5171) TaxID=1116229 RepID=S3CWY1_GLAL2|nr:uncharacterized protein GLAREA_08162 [Glarea lozoyensis ATCC 20868]EPE24311.1 hypothetical protein GLAREA_08162 [Glarea lozoyensis ATCC 20868]